MTKKTPADEASAGVFLHFFSPQRTADLLRNVQSFLIQLKMFVE